MEYHIIYIKDGYGIAQKFRIVENIYGYCFLQNEVEKITETYFGLGKDIITKIWKTCTIRVAGFSGYEGNSLSWVTCIEYNSSYKPEQMNKEYILHQLEIYRKDNETYMKIGENGNWYNVTCASKNNKNQKTKESKMKNKSNYEKAMDLKKEYNDKKLELERVQKELMIIKERAKEELNWILNDEVNEIKEQ